MQTQIFEWQRRARGFPCPMLQIRWWGNASFGNKRRVMFHAVAARGQCPAPKLNICCVTCDSPISQRKNSTQRLCLHSRLNFSGVDAKPGLNAIFSMPKDVWLWFKILKQLEDCLGYLALHPQSWKHHWQDKINKVPHVFFNYLNVVNYFFFLWTPTYVPINNH